MTGTSKKPDKILDGLKDLLSSDKEEEKKTTKSTAKKTTVKGTVKPSAAKSKTVKAKVSKEAKESLKAYESDKAKKKQLEVLHSKTHQDLINVAYKAAEKLGIAPWVLLRAAEWGHFTDDRGKKYDGPAIDDLKGLDDAQKKALKDELGL
jgi:hypothetical protein